jgi:aldose 1-epimerase
MTKELITLLKNGFYAAEISNFGAALASLRFQNKDLIEPRLDSRYFSGEILAPWPNRIADGKYSYKGKVFQLKINEKSRNNALHGLVFDKPWKVLEAEESKVSLQITIDDKKIYPGPLDLQITYVLDGKGFLSTLVATNTGSVELPYGASSHPYITVPGISSVNEYWLRLGSSQVFLTDDERLLPSRLVDVTEANLDFRKVAKIDKRFIDHAFMLDKDFPSSVLIASESGEGVLISFDDETNWIQIHTADRNGAIDGRKSLAVEPMTCPPDAFNSGLNLITLAPGEEHQLRWRISYVNQN